MKITAIVVVLALAACAAGEAAAAHTGPVDLLEPRPLAAKRG